MGKKDCQTKIGVNNFRKFAPVTERILFYSKEVNQTGLEKIKLDINNFKTLRNYFQELQNFIKTPKKYIIDKIGQCADHCFRHSSTQWDLPTETTYNELIQHFNIDSWDGFRTYESLRQEYESLRRFFDNKNGFTDILKFSQEVHITGKYKHPTQKPPKLINMLIQVCTREGDLVYSPFCGSGVDCEQAKVLKRNYIGSEIDPNYCDIARKRVDDVVSEGVLF